MPLRVIILVDSSLIIGVADNQTFFVRIIDLLILCLQGFKCQLAALEPSVY